MSSLVSPKMLESQPSPTYEELIHENNELKNNLQTLLEYNNKLLGIIQDLNSNPSSTMVSHQRCTQQSKFLWKKLSALQSYSYQLEMQLQQHRNQKHNQQQIQKQLKQVLESNQIVQRKFQMKTMQVLQEIQQIKGSQELASERVVQLMEDRQKKIQQIYGQFQQKDELIELFTQKIRLFQQQYIKKETRESGFSVSNRQHGSGRVSYDGKVNFCDITTQTEGFMKKQNYAQQQLKEYKRVIEIYEGLMRKVKTKLQDRIA